MATYVVGDIHGCFQTFQALLEAVRFEPASDRLWLVGDLVNGGPDSLEVLRWSVQHEDRLTVVLGNHDVYLLGRAWNVRERKKRDTLDDLLAAPDCGQLMQWLQHRPLIHREGPNVLVHAGLPPQWRTAQAEQLARQAEESLRGEGAAQFLRQVFDQKLDNWSETTDRQSQLCFAVQALTNIRTCRPDGSLCLEFSGPPEEAPQECSPWFSRKHLAPEQKTLFFGHWSALGFRRVNGTVALDSGCVWGRELTALRLEDGAVFQQASLEESEDE